jgi:toxin ParE1/3/4
VSGYRLSRLAEADLTAIFCYTLDTWGEEQVWIYLQILESARDQIAADPFCFGSKDREDLAAGCRIFRAAKHHIIYRVVRGRVEIARVLHESMDFERRVDDSAFD